MNKIIKNISYSLVANLISTFVSLLTTLVLPKFFGYEITQYGYYQIFIFYIGYVGFFHFGWCDGLYLRDGGKEYSNLDFGLYSIQYKLLFVLEFLIALILILYAVIFTKSSDYKFIFIMIALNILLVIPQTMLSFILQTTNRIKEYANITIMSRFIYGLLLIIIILFRLKDYKIIIVSYNISYAFSLILSVIYCRDIVYFKAASLTFGVVEAVKNISVGSKLMFSNIVNLLITGVVRVGIQMRWDVSTYGKISLALSITNMFLILINAVSIVLYPMFKQKDEKKLIRIYKIMNNMTMIFLFSILILYYPIRNLLSYWLPQYSESLEYLALLFPLCVYSAKMNMIVSTYMKVLRFEKLMLLVNLCGLGVAFITTFVSVIVLSNLQFAILMIIFNQVFRSVIAEYLLSKRLKIDLNSDIILEILLTTSFIIFSWMIGGWIGMMLYGTLYFAYLILKKEYVKFIVQKTFFDQAGR